MALVPNFVSRRSANETQSLTLVNLKLLEAEFTELDYVERDQVNTAYSPNHQHTSPAPEEPAPASIAAPVPRRDMVSANTRSQTRGPKAAINAAKAKDVQASEGTDANRALHSTVPDSDPC